MDYLKQLATVEDIIGELNKVAIEEEKLNRLILFNLTGNQDYYDLSDSAEVIKSSAIEYNRIAKDLCSVGSSVNRIFYIPIFNKILQMKWRKYLRKWHLVAQMLFQQVRVSNITIH